jgi:signal transduction histidine kinase
MTGTHLDISERMAAEEALRQTNKKLNLLSSLVRHDILNKVSILLGYIDRAKCLTKEPTLVDYLDRLETSTKAIGKLVKFTRDYKDLGINPPRWFALKDCVNEVTEWIDPNSIRLDMDLGEWEIYTDPQVTKAFRNIFENAGIHGKNVSEIIVKSTKDDRGLTLIISDNGIGIPEEMKKEIFEPGMMRNRGLGLFFAKEILSITGLTIEETGVPGKGAQFEIHVPPGGFRIPQNHQGNKKNPTSVLEQAQ